MHLHLREFPDREQADAFLAGLAFADEHRFEKLCSFTSQQGSCPLVVVIKDRSCEAADNHLNFRALHEICIHLNLWRADIRAVVELSDTFFHREYLLQEALNAGADPEFLACQLVNNALAAQVAAADWAQDLTVALTAVLEEREVLINFELEQKIDELVERAQEAAAQRLV